MLGGRYEAVDNRGSSQAQVIVPIEEEDGTLLDHRLSQKEETKKVALGKGEGGRDGIKKQGILAKVRQALVTTVEKDRTFDDARIEKNVPVAVLVPVWMLGKIVFLFVLAYLTATMTQTDQVKEYLSPAYIFGSASAYRLCKFIPASFSGTFLLDSNGFWQGTTAFEGGKSKYLVTFNNFVHTYPNTRTS